MADRQYVHRTTHLKQVNKAHKTGRHRSKSAIEKTLKGKSGGSIVKHKHKRVIRKEQKRNHINQLRKIKCDQVYELKKELGSMNGPPFMVCVLPMHRLVDPNSVMAILEKCDEYNRVERTECGITYIAMPRFKQRFAFVCPPIGRGNDVAVLDCLKVCDTTLLVMSSYTGDEELLFDKWGFRIFNMISAQGLPAPIPVLMDLESLNPKYRLSSKNNAQKFISTLLPNEKLIKLDTNSEGLNLLRRIGNQKRNIIHNRNNRPHLISDSIALLPDSQNGSDQCTLQVTGFLRGVSLNVNNLIHIVGFGDFQMNEIIGKVREIKSNGVAGSEHEQQQQKRLEVINEKIQVSFKADPMKQTSLQSENIPDEMDAEQTWPTEAEIEQSQKETIQMKPIKRVPKGFSDYQAAWIPDIEYVEKINEEEDEEDMGIEGDMSYEEESSMADEHSDSENCINTVDTYTEEECNKDDEKYDQEMDFQAEREMIQKIKEARSDQMWPDQIDIPTNEPLRIRFQKYRGLESFKTSPWDPKENLPRDYARIYQFRNFQHTKQRIIAEAKDVIGPKPGCYVTIYVPNVYISKWQEFRRAQVSEFIVIYGLLPHEHQMSAVNVVLRRVDEGSVVPIKSKEPLIIQCGYRRYTVNPIFSQHTNGDKHKFERYFRPHTTVCATFYAPMQFPPSPVLAFNTNPDSTLNLVARGCLLSCNPDRIILKRVVLSGHPIRIYRKTATIGYMFYNKEDVHYFKPIKLRTKCGRVGHIKESLGTHGHMKCYFDGQLRSYDTVLMYLYKRVFPKWTYNNCLITLEKETSNTQCNNNHTIDNDNQDNRMQE